jgi:hypothetical protein
MYAGNRGLEGLRYVSGYESSASSVNDRGTIYKRFGDKPYHEACCAGLGTFLGTIVRTRSEFSDPV